MQATESSRPMHTTGIMIDSCPAVMWLSDPIDHRVNIFSCSAELRYCNIWMMAPAT